MRTLNVLRAAVVLALFLSAPARAGNIVANAGFETGDLTGWTVNLDSNNIWQVDGHGLGPNTGNHWATAGCSNAFLDCMSGSTANFLYQDLTTVNGDNYTLSFYFANGNTPWQLQVYFGTELTFDLSGQSAATSYDFYNTTVQASATTTRLEFIGRQDPGWNSLDDIVVTDLGQGVPEPSGVLLSLAGVIAVYAIRNIRA